MDMLRLPVMASNAIGQPLENPSSIISLYGRYTQCNHKHKANTCIKIPNKFSSLFTSGKVTLIQGFGGVVVRIKFPRSFAHRFIKLELQNMAHKVTMPQNNLRYHNIDYVSK